MLDLILTHKKIISKNNMKIIVKRISELYV